MWLWVDDLRPAPPGWTWVRSVDAATVALTTGDVEYASLDHDLGDHAAAGGDGTRLTDWMAEHDRWPTRGLRVHSANPVGVRVMLTTVDTYGPYPPGTGTRRGTWDPAVVATLTTAGPDRPHT